MPPAQARLAPPPTRPPWCASDPLASLAALQRVNGRVAMLGFASVAAAELSSKTPALEQAGDAWLSIVFVSALFSIASIMPKFISGTSLKELHAAATSDALKGEGLQAALALFDTNIELWAGRLAMIGFVGLAITEKVIGDALFG